MAARVNTALFCRKAGQRFRFHIFSMGGRCGTRFDGN